MTSPESTAPAPSRRRWAGPAAALAGTGAALVPGPAGPLDPFVVLALAGPWAPALACLAGAWSGRWWSSAGWVSLGLVLGYAIAVGFGARTDLGFPGWQASLGCTGLLMGAGLAGAGFGLALGAIGGGGQRLAVHVAGAWVAAMSLLQALPGRLELPQGDRVPAGWAQGSPERGARVLDLSPATWFFEVAGHDWMRHPAVYGPAGTDWFSGSRAPVDGALAGSLALVLGCALGGLCVAFRARRAASHDAS